ncbi:MAG TPA: glycosyltransferase, partial [Caulobacteraceae bacterium]|nr:glycosyltransferase [Caulobacteraceae bacterium]
MLSRRKIVLSTCGSSGDLNPFIAIALELRARGYFPVIATQSEFGPRVEAEGLAFHPMRPGARDISGAISFFTLHQAPELYAGVNRTPSNFPVQYLGANAPQAWAAGSCF